MVGSRAAAGVLALGVVVAACGGGDGGSGGDASSDEGREYVEAIVAANAADDDDFTADLSDDEQECVAGAMVDAIGLAQLQAAVTPDEIRENPEAEAADLGIEIDEEQAETFWEGVNECVDVSEFAASAFAEGFAETQELSQEAVACLEGEFDDDLVENVFKPLIVTSLVEGEDAADEALEEDEEVVGEVIDLVAACVDLRELFVSEVAEEEDLSDEAVACLEAELDEDFLKRLMVKSIVEGEEALDEALEEDEEFAGELFGVFAACPQAIPDFGD